MSITPVRWLIVHGPKGQQLRSVGWEGESVGWVERRDDSARDAKPVSKLKQRNDGSLWFRCVNSEQVVWPAGTWKIAFEDQDDLDD
jgi:hypothetical protein